MESPNKSMYDEEMLSISGKEILELFKWSTASTAKTVVLFVVLIVLGIGGMVWLAYATNRPVPPPAPVPNSGVYFNAPVYVEGSMTVSK